MSPRWLPMQVSVLKAGLRRSKSNLRGWNRCPTWRQRGIAVVVRATTAVRRVDLPAGGEVTFLKAQNSIFSSTFFNGGTVNFEFSKSWLDTLVQILALSLCAEEEEPIVRVGVTCLQQTSLLQPISCLLQNARIIMNEHAISEHNTRLFVE